MEASEIAKLLVRKVELETLLNGFEKWLIFFGVLVAIGVAGESIWGFRAWWNNRKLHTVTESIDLLKTRQSEERAKGFDVAIAASKLETKRLEQENIILRGKMQDRRLSKDQRLALRDKMRGFPAPQAWQIIIFSNDGEARGLGVDIQESVVGVNGAAWPTPNISSNQTSMPIRGVRVQYAVNADSALQSVAKALSDVLRWAKLEEVDGPHQFTPLPPMQTGGAFISTNIGGSANPNAPITLIIGRKP